MIDLLPWQKPTLQGLLQRRASLPHALVVHGRSGIGKVLFARALAQSLLCEAPEEQLACGHCSACQWFAEGNHPDFRELHPEELDAEDAGDGAEADSGDGKAKKKSREIKIEQVRAVANFMTLSTHRDGFRVLVIQPAESLNASAANALLKTLEEPPARTAIILVADQLGRLLATIRSRCQKVLLPTPPPESALAWLQLQGIANAEDALAAAGGAPLAAIAYAAPEYRQARDAFLKALATSPLDYAASGQTFEKTDPAQIILWLQAWVSDLILCRSIGSVRHHPSHVTALKTIASKCSLPRLFRYEADLRQSRRLAHHPLNPRLFVEQLLISYAQATRPA